MKHQVIMAGVLAGDDGLRIDMGPLDRRAWWEVPLPPCPDCSGDLVWWEAGYVSGTRKCLGQPVDREDDGRPIYDTAGGCGSLFSVQAGDGKVHLRRERLY